MAQGLKAGTLLDHGMYRLERILGSGGFGITYLVTDLGLDKLRAMKEFFPKDYCDRDDTTSHVTLGTSNTVEFVDKLKKKFIKEARNISHLDQHSGIITIHRVFEENNTAYYVMDYIEGENLSEIVKRDGPLPVDKAIKYIIEVGNALEYVHKHHINHLDIKPANIMIRRSDDSPILIDFGLSKQYDSEGLQTSTTPTGISHGYAPIEQYNDGGVKEFYPQTDIYSLAATLFYLVSGKIPPHATSLTQNDLTFPEGFPYFLKKPISKAMSTKRGQRHETVKEFIASLETEDEATVIEDPNRNGNIPVSENRNGSLPTSEEKRDENIPVSENRNGSLPTSDNSSGGGIPASGNSYGNLSSSDNRSEIKPDSTGNKGNKTRGRQKYNFPAYFKKHRKITLVCFIAICIFCGSFLGVLFAKIKLSIESDNVIYTKSDNTQNIPENQNIINTPKTVENLAYKSSLGLCSYTGEVDENNLPHGHGVATWETGEGKEYDGEWVHGVMEGQTKYTHRSGDTFEGTFKNNQYSEGRYTIKETGEYFEGTFKNGQPYQGKWHDKSERKLLTKEKVEEFTKDHNHDDELTKIPESELTSIHYN